MSFYACIKTEVTNRKYVIAALKELEHRGEITRYTVNERKGKIEVDRDGDILTVIKEKRGNNFEVRGEIKAAKKFSERMKQFYAYESIKDNLPLDFEIAEEQERRGDIYILLKS